MNELSSATVVPEVQALEMGAQPVEAKPVVHVSDRLEDSGAELEKIRQELEGRSPQVVAPNPSPVVEATKEPTQPTTPAAVTPQQAQPALAVPDKFKTPDGKMDQERVLKSALEAEKELKRLQNQRHQWQQAAPAQPVPQAQVQVPTPVPGQPLTFEQQIEADIQKYGAGPVLARLFQASQEAAVSQTLTPVQSLLEAQENLAREGELREIMKNAPEVFTPETIESLKQIRQERPDINNVAEPWKAALEVHLGRQAYRQRVGYSGQVQTPTPTAPTAPMAPVGAAPSQQTTVIGKTMTKAELESHLSRLTPEQEDEFWKKQLGAAGFQTRQQRVPVRK